ncbi:MULTISPECIES: CheW domain-containing protein [Planktothricoides]|uniref:CheW domain-containing protein n=2 Tax=Planktothricoides raciborskii TaxID=132608 RepID=A0AAU8JCJ1_9CYAN|nr:MULTISPECIES: CheW domain-containing protein [Planktothricoides]KOR33811.1 chemotaxis protein [Planktothricoides sp. SR001]MBD2547831.1 CheW domain-containing protein [Planktothricoides raciborskii FACHB-1370]MBD2586269.1 CheW domain-containing protein [Planktothricoides raciborskii FACHB-1261]
MVGNPDFNIGSEAAEFQEIQTPEGELYLRFYISSGDEFALPATGIREVIEAGSEEITPIPNVSPFLLGTLNLRGRVIWVADLGQLLGDVSPLKTDRSEIPVIAVEDSDIILGLAVDRIGDTDWLDVKSLIQPNSVTETMRPFLRGEWVFGEESQRILRLLDQGEILRPKHWAS